MSFFNRKITLPALAGAAVLACPLAAMAAVNTPQTETTSAAAKPETVEQRIATLHTALNITASEETAWTAVARTMRENAAVMDKLLTERAAGGPRSVTALDNLKFYEKFAHAHVDGLTALTDSFAVLYAAMPDAQKKVADQVFANFGHRGTAAHG